MLRNVRSIALVLCLSVLLGVLTYGSDTASAAAAAAQDCPEGQVLSSNGVTCELDVGQGGSGDGGNSVCPDGQELDAAGLFCQPIDDGSEDAICPAGQQLDGAGLMCEDIPPEPGSKCPTGQVLDDAGLVCIDDPDAEDAEPACSEGYSLGADDETCIADGPDCENGEVGDTDGGCIKSFSCAPGLILASDLLSCISDRCPADELLSNDGKRCLAKKSECPDGSPRPVGGACLVVETVEGPDGPEVVVRCAEGDTYCEAQVKRCAEERAESGSDEDQPCEDPRVNCDDGDDECEQANDRLVECATRDDDGAEAEDAGERQSGVRIGGRDDPCTDLCPDLHRLDASGECIEYLDPKHPCVSFGNVPAGVTTNEQLNGFSYLAGTGQCVTKTEFLRRLGNFEAAAGAEADALALLRETTSTYLTVEEQLAALEQRLVVTRRAIRQFTDAAAEADVERTQTIKRLADTRKSLSREREILRGEVQDVFVIGGNDAAIEAAILKSSNVTDIGVAQVYGRALLDDQISNVERVEKLERDAVVLSRRAEASLAEVEESLAAAVEASDSLEQLLIDSRDLRQEQVERRDEEAELVAQIREDKATYAQELGIFEQASREIADILSETEFLVGEFENCGGSFGNPVLPAIASSGFGPRLHPILGYVRQHNGLDLSAGFGEPIYASAPGIVQIASTFGGYGETVVLAHGGEFYSLYAHMSVITVEPGEEVECGAVIGLVGSTGLSTGPHLHFEIWDETKTAINPAPYLLNLGR